METNCPHQPPCQVGTFNRCCVIYGMWNGNLSVKHQATDATDARAKALELLGQGYAVSLSNALILELGRSVAHA